MKSQRPRSDTLRDMAAAMIGRDLTPDEVVHHLDGDPWNNLPENILVCTRAWHYRIHLKQGGHSGRWIRFANGK